jgi:hypothetical protein
MIGGSVLNNYTVEKMYAFLSGHRLKRNPGEKFQYSNVRHEFARNRDAWNSTTRTNFESLVIRLGSADRSACESTCITLNA